MGDQRSSRAAKSCVVSTILFVVLVAIGGDRAWSSDGDGEYDRIIFRLAREHGVEAALVKAVIQAESGFDPDAVSPRGARGLMQLMPLVAKSHGVKNPSDPSQNIRGGVRLLRKLLDRFDNDSRLALAAYNAGGATVERYGGLPPYGETRRYVAAVLRFRANYLNEERRARLAAEGDGAAPALRAQNTRAMMASWPRRAESLWYGAGESSDGGALRAALHSPEDEIGRVRRDLPSVP